MRYPIWVLLGAAGLALVAGNGDARAQDADQEVWIGQTGQTNTITVTQQGNGNRAGHDNANLRLDQDGEFNFLSIDQYGWSNALGAELRGDDPLGFNQIGDRNSVTVEQRNEDPLGSNTIGAILQQGPRLNGTDANILFIRQDAAGGADLTARHSIGTVIQINDGPAGGAANSASIRQSGGGEDGGNTIGAIAQQGQGNILAVSQDNQSNLVEAIRQQGTANDATIDEGGGAANSLQLFEQYGDSNQADVRLSGSRNYVQRLLQNNDYSAGVGNRAKIVLTGSDNGGDGVRGPGEFLATETLELLGGVQGNLVQIGDDNDARITVSQGLLTKYGVWQEGDGNGAILSVSATNGQQAAGNELAVFQHGLDNNLSNNVVGSANVMAASQDGQRNRAALRQEGTGNIATVSILGDDNNAPNAGAFDHSSLAVAEQVSLTPGQMVQSGLSNRAGLAIDGSDNLAAFLQHGDTNQLSARMSGNSNAIAVAQGGNTNTSITVQSGTGNSLGVRQY